jgi:hypothetical protein
MAENHEKPVSMEELKSMLDETLATLQNAEKILQQTLGMAQETNRELTYKILKDSW